MALVLRGQPTDGESPAGYLLRISAQNEYERPSVLLWHYNHPVDLFSRTSVKPSADRMGLTTVEIDKWFYDVKATVARGVFGHTMPRWHLRTYFPKVCPHCIKEGKVLASIWDLSLTVCCPVHQTMLISHCDCDGSLHWNRKHPNYCGQCDRALAKVKTRMASEPLVQFTKVLANKAQPKLYSRPESSLMRLTGASSFIEFLSLSEPFVRIFVGRPDKLSGRKSYSSEVDERLECGVIFAAQALCEWPGSLFGAIDALRRYPQHEHALRMFGYPFKQLAKRRGLHFLQQTVDEIGNLFGRNVPEEPSYSPQRNRWIEEAKLSERHWGRRIVPNI